MKFYLSCMLFMAMLYPCAATAQENKDKKDKIAKVLNDYFHLERENIHVHFDKSIFLTNEQIWFKGYVFHRKLNIPFYSTTNIYANLIDSDGNILETQLLYGNIGTFSGSFKLSDAFKSGKYYLQFYTNWMNNFIEDESAVHEIEVINPTQGVASALGKPVLSNINIAMHPEGGSFIQGVSNSIGVSVADCNNNPVPATAIEIVASTGEVLKTVQLNKLGYGRFDVAANSPAGLKAVVTINGVKHEKELPPSEIKGVAMEVNNYAVADKLIAKIKTNKITNTSYEGKSFFMVIQQDEKSIITEFSFRDGKLEETIVIPQADLFNGTNTIRILDTDLNQIAERLIFKYPKETVTTTVKQTKQNAEYTSLTASTGKPLMNLSVSVVPENTISLNQNNDIYGSLLISPYVNDRKNISGRYFFETLTKAKHYELDLLLLNRLGKYKWRDILQNPPKSTHKFDMGLALKATINSNLAKKKNAKVRVYSIGSLIDEHVDINTQNEIYLENLILTDSTRIDFSLLEAGVKKEQIKLYPQVFNNTRKFNKPYKPVKSECAATGTVDNISFEIPEFNKSTVILDELAVEVNRKELRYKRAPGNSQLRGYKIGDHEAKGYFYILDYIRYHGFDVTNNGVNIGIFGRTTNTINGQRTQPMVYIDNVYVMSFDILQGMQTGDVDEFYVNQHAIVPSVNNKMGIIRIFMKKGFNVAGKSIADTSFIVKDGFEKAPKFENAMYNSTSDKGFENFGLIDWDPTILPDAKGEFTLEIPRTSQKTVKLLIEGFNAEGKMISEIKTIRIN